MLILCINLKQNILQMKPQSLNLKTEPFSPKIAQVPLKEEWGLINNFKAIEFQKMQQHQKLLDREKKMNFKKQLDQQLNSKANSHLRELEDDKKYYEYIIKKGEEQRTREEQEKIDRFYKRKQMEKANLNKLESIYNSKRIDSDHGYHLDIGERSEFQRKQKTQIHQKQMMDTLDVQLRQKYIQMERTRAHNLELDQKSLRYQDELFNRRSVGKHYGQNPNVYKYYQLLDQEKHAKQRELEKRFVDQAMKKKVKEEMEKKYLQEIHQHEMKEKVKQTLNQQVKEANIRKHEQNQVNPQELTYGIIKGVFRERPSPYDKAAYTADLLRQAQEQKQRKKLQKYMSEEQYKINMNQLNKAVNGTYSYRDYLDRSLGSIGDNNRYKLEEISHQNKDHDAQIVRERLNHLKNRGRSSFINKDSRIF